MENTMETTVTDSAPKVMIICDNYQGAVIWKFLFEQNGMHVILLNQDEGVLELWEEEIPDLIILEINGTQKERIKLCKKIRSSSVMPILLILPSYLEDQILESYQAGVDECLVKPISPVVLLARVRAWLRRTWMLPVNGLERVGSDKLVLDPNFRAVVTEDGEVIRLTSLEFRFMHLLMSKPGTVFKTHHIVRSVWGAYGQGDSVLLKNVVYRLRKKLEADLSQPSMIQNWHGEGYSFQV